MPKAPAKDIMSVRKVLSYGYSLFNKEEKYIFKSLVIFNALSGLLEIASLFAFYPFISILISPENISTNSHIYSIWMLVGRPSDEAFLSLFAIVVSVLLLSCFLINILVNSLSSNFSCNAQKRLASDLYSSIINAPYHWHLQQNPHIISSIFSNHLVIWSRDYVRKLLSLSNQLASILLPLIILAFTYPILTFFTIPAIYLLFKASNKIVKSKTVKLLSEKKIFEEKLSIYTSETIQGIKDVKLSRSSNDFLDKFNSLYLITSNSYFTVSNISYITAQCFWISAQILVIVISLYLSFSGMSGPQLASSIGLTVLLSSRIIPAVTRSQAGVTSLRNTFPWISFISNVNGSILTHNVNDFDYSCDNSFPYWSSIALENVNFAYPNASNKAIKNVSAEIRKGQWTSIIGSSGSGKSTILDLISGLISPTEGCIKIDGSLVQNNNIKALQKIISYVPQEPMIKDASIKENIAYGIPEFEIDTDLVQHCINCTRLNGVVDEIGFETPLGDRGKRLSGGQRQRVAIARALYNKSDIILLDEATSSLDSITENAILELLNDLNGGVTIIFVTHNIAASKYSDSILLIDHGCLVAQGSYEQLSSDNQFFQQMLKSLD